MGKRKIPGTEVIKRQKSSREEDSLEITGCLSVTD